MDFETLGVMIDCSRNAVPTVNTLKTMADLLAEMGYNRMELYIEDTYEIKGRPYFGHLRGRYSGSEIKEIDAYAAGRGIELMPCIQVLAHINQIFQWPEFDKVHDCSDILLIDEPETYALIGDMFKSLSENFSSRNVNIGCDEAFMVGLGKFLQKHGYQNRFEIVNRHIAKVLEIAGKYGFRCSMWSDMYFRLAFNGVYRSSEPRDFPAEIAALAPKNVTLVYWDYDYTGVEHYRNMFASHKKFANDVAFAGGAWKWRGFAPANRFSMKCADAAVRAARENGIKTMTVTAWGDNGGEASLFSVLPSLYYFARLCKGQSVAPEELERGFKKLTGAGFNDFLDIEEIDNYPWNNAERNPPASKYFLYNDCFLGIQDSLIEGGEGAHYRAVAEKIKNKTYGKFSFIFDTMRMLAEALELKADLGVRTRELYKDGDREGLKKLAEDYKETEKRVRAFHARFEAQWLKENKPFGFEVQDMRLGGLILRIDSCRRRLLDYCEGKIDEIPELGEEVLKAPGRIEHLRIVSAGIV